MLRGIFWIGVCLAMIVVGVWIFEAVLWWAGFAVLAVAGLGFMYGLYVLLIGDGVDE